MKDDIVSSAIAFAYQAHRGQTYGGKPYVAHLVAVVSNIHLFSFRTDVLEAAAWLHDAVEDTEVTIADVRQTCGDEVAELVFAVTNEDGKNRKERNARTYPKILAVPGALTLKLADRIANVESCWETRNSKLFMYQREYHDFRKALYREARSPEEVGIILMWNRLDELLGWWEPG